MRSDRFCGLHPDRDDDLAALLLLLLARADLGARDAGVLSLDGADVGAVGSVGGSEVLPDGSRRASLIGRGPAAVPASITGELRAGAIVVVGPPLPRREPSCGFAPIRLLPAGDWVTVAPVVLPTRLKPRSNDPSPMLSARSGDAPPTLPAMIVFRIVSVSSPGGAPSLAYRKMPPPAVAAVLPAIVEERMSTEPSYSL